MALNKTKTITIAVLILVILASGYILGVPFVKHKILESKIRQSLLETYPGADIRGIDCNNKPVTQDQFEDEYAIHWYEWMGSGWPEDELYVFRVDIGEDDPNAFSIRGLASEDGTVVFDSYASVYYREQTQSYVMGILEPEVNFPECEIVYYDLNISNRNRLVPTSSCSTFEGYLDAENVGYGWRSSHGASACYITVGIDVYDNEQKLEVCQRLSDLLLESDCQVYIEFCDAGHGEIVARYYACDLEGMSSRFVPMDNYVRREMGFELDWPDDTDE